MAKGISINIFGLKETKNFIIKKGKRAIALADKGVANATLHINNEVRSSITGQRAEKRSVDTSRFLQSVTPDTKKGIVFTNIPYSKFLEFGTSKMKARKHFSNSAFREKGKVKEIIQNEVNKI